MKSLCSCATILANSRTNIKEKYSSLYHVMARLAKQEQLDRCVWNYLFIKNTNTNTNETPETVCPSIKKTCKFYN